MTSIERRFIQIAHIMRYVSGFDLEKDTASRKEPLPKLRAMVMKKMREEGYTLECIGELFGKDHSTVQIMTAKIDDMLKYPMHSDESLMQIYKDFYSLCGNGITIKLTKDEYDSLQSVLSKLNIRL